MKKYFPWLGAAAILVVIFGTIYTVTQQAQRNDANYPQIQLAEDTAARLDSGGEPASLAQGSVDINKSLSPFVAIYDKSGNVVAASGSLDGKLPTVPFGVLAAARGNDYHVVSWQPKSDLRIAAVTVAARNYYVLSGRSLKEIEANESQSFLLSAFGGFVSIGILGTVYFLTSRSVKR